jgi:hypothetical protein
LSLTLREEQGLRVFQKRVLRRIFGPKRGEVIGGWRKLLNEELPNLYSFPSIIRMIKPKRVRLARHVARMEAKRNVYRILVGNLEGTRPLGRPVRTWKGDVKMDFREIGWVVWAGFIWLRIGTSGDLLEIW